MNSDLISRSELKKAIEELEITEELVDYDCDDISTTGVSQYLDRPDVLNLIDNAPTVATERLQTISCFNCKHDYKSAADEPCKYCEKHCKWQAKVRT